MLNQLASPTKKEKSLLAEAKQHALPHPQVVLTAAGQKSTAGGPLPPPVPTRTE